LALFRPDSYIVDPYNQQQQSISFVINGSSPVQDSHACSLILWGWEQRMIRGILDIRKLSNPGSDIDVYQVHFEERAGGTYDASLTEAAVEDLLYNKLRLDLEVDDLHAQVDELKRTGRTTFEDMEIEEAELTASGLSYLPYAG